MPRQGQGKHGAWKWSQPERENTWSLYPNLTHMTGGINATHQLLLLNIGWSPLQPAVPQQLLLPQPRRFSSSSLAWTSILCWGLTTLFKYRQLAPGSRTLSKLISYPPVGQHILLAFSWFVGVRAHLNQKKFNFRLMTKHMFFNLDGVMLLFKCTWQWLAISSS